REPFAVHRTSLRLARVVLRTGRARELPLVERRVGGVRDVIEGVVRDAARSDLHVAAVRPVQPEDGEIVVALGDLLVVFGELVRSHDGSMMEPGSGAMVERDRSGEAIRVLENLEAFQVLFRGAAVEAATRVVSEDARIGPVARPRCTSATRLERQVRAAGRVAEAGREVPVGARGE